VYLGIIHLFSDKPRADKGKKRSGQNSFVEPTLAAHVHIYCWGGQFSVVFDTPFYAGISDSTFSILHATYDGSSTLGPWEIPLAILKLIRQS
jgi:hypothetical protein